MMAIVRAHVERVEVRRPRRGLPRPRGAVLAARGDAPAGRGDQGRHPADLLGRHRPEQARGEGRLRRREAGRASSCSRREQACARFARLAAAAGARASARRPPSAWHALGLRHARGAAARRPSSCSSSASAPTTAVNCSGARASNTTARVGAARKVVSESRERTFDHDMHDPRAAARGADARWPGELCESLAPTRRAAGARSGSRSASTTSRRSRARTRCPRRRATRGRDRAGAARCSSEYAPAAAGAPAGRARRRASRRALRARGAEQPRTPAASDGAASSCRSAAASRSAQPRV